MILSGPVLAGPAIAEVGPFAPKVAKKKKTKKKRPQRKIAKKKPAEQTAKKKSDPPPAQADALGILATQEPTLAEISGYRSAIAQLEPNRKNLDSKKLVELGEFYAFGALEYPENTQWADSAVVGLVKDLGKGEKNDPAATRLNLASELAIGKADVLAKIETLAGEAPRDAKTLMLLGYGRLSNGDNKGAFNAFQRGLSIRS